MKIFTVGYEGCDIDDFVQFLADKKIDIVADVRKNPISRKRGFSKTKLAENLAKKKIEYVHFKGLGVPTLWRNRAKHKIISREKMFKDYVDQILPEHAEEIKTLRTLVKKSKCAILCYEADASDCHRRRVTDHLKSKNDKVIDLKLPGTKT